MYSFTLLFSIVVLYFYHRINNTEANMITASATLQKYISTRDKRVAQVDAINHPARISELFAELITKKQVRVGGRSSCGTGKVDATWIQFTSWNEVVSKANKLGYRIQVNSIKQDNKSPTMAQGWWHENEYVLVSA
jgi:hypothetical protein